MTEDNKQEEHKGWGLLELIKCGKCKGRVVYIEDRKILKCLKCKAEKTIKNKNT